MRSPEPKTALPTLETASLAARQFGAAVGETTSGDLHLVNAGVNTVYRAGDRALRMVREEQKDRNYLTPPLEWLRHLHAAGAPVCEPLPTLDGDWIGAFRQDSDTFLATAVRWVDGLRLSELPATPTLYREYGRSIGRLHRASRGYVPSPTAPHMLGLEDGGVFPRWESLWQRAAEHVSGASVLQRAFERLTPDVLAWGAEERVTTHGDLRPGNVIWQGSVTASSVVGSSAVVIDFDEPVLGPAALDLARAALELNAAERPTLLAALLEGYRLEHGLGAVWDARIPTLMAARAALMCAWNMEDGPTGSDTGGGATGSGAVVSLPTLLSRLERWDF